jgi:hypothetical protein
MKNERRHDRSARPDEAIALFLDAAKKKLSVRALTLGTMDGDLLFGSGEDLERIADIGAKVDAGEAQNKDIATWRTRVGNTSVVVTSWGGRLSVDLGDGLRRIFAVETLSP